MGSKDFESEEEGKAVRGRAGSALFVDVNFVICGISRTAAAEQEESVPVDYHACPLNAPGCCASTRVRSEPASAAHDMAKKERKKPCFLVRFDCD